MRSGMWAILIISTKNSPKITPHTSHFTHHILQLTPKAKTHKIKEIIPSRFKVNPEYNTNTELMVKPIIPK